MKKKSRCNNGEYTRWDKMERNHGMSLIYIVKETELMSVYLELLDALNGVFGVMVLSSQPLKLGKGGGLRRFF